MRRFVIAAVLVLLVVFAMILFVDAKRRAAEDAFLYDPAFAAGSFPAPLPRGYYHEPIPAGRTSWSGKTFLVTGMKGTDGRRSDGTDVVTASFSLRKAPQIGNAEKDALVLDFNVPGTPPWLRPELDELVETTPDAFLVKRYYRLPGKMLYMGYQSLVR
jgi:hypothetical protein